MSAFGVFTFVEAAVLLVAAAVLFLVWARSQQKGFHLPGGDGVAITIAGGWAMLLLIWRLFDKPDIQGAGATMGIQWGIFGAMLAAGALIVAGARVRALHAPEPPNPAADEVGWVSPARASVNAHRTAGPATRPRSPRCSASGRPGRAKRRIRRASRPTSGWVTSPRRGCPTTERTARLFEDPSRADTTRLDEKPTSPRIRPRRPRGANADLTVRGRSGTTTGADAPPLAPGYRSSPDRPMTGGVNLSAASIYQIDERGLELRRSYMRMTPAEFELLGGMQAWAGRNADAIGKALAEHTFTAGPAGGFLREYAEGKGIALDALKKGWGSAQAGHFKDIFKEAATPGGFGVKYFEALLGVGALHSKINLPLKWFLGTYPVFIDLVHDAMLDDVPEPARIEKKVLGRAPRASTTRCWPPPSAR